MYSANDQLPFVENDWVDWTTFNRLLNQEGLRHGCVIASSLEQALHLFGRDSFDIIELDYLHQMALKPYRLKSRSTTGNPKTLSGESWASCLPRVQTFPITRG